MARVPQYPYREEIRRRRRDVEPVIKPAGRFVRETKVHLATDRSPRAVTSINPEAMEPILPEMPYIPPA
jgi:hypothetical protein